MDLASGWDYSSGSQAAGLFPISKTAGPEWLTGAIPVGFLGGRGPGRIPASHLFREIFVGKDQVDRLEVTQGLTNPWSIALKGKGQPNRSFGGGLIEEQARAGFSEEEDVWGGALWRASENRFRPGLTRGGCLLEI